MRGLWTYTSLDEGLEQTVDDRLYVELVSGIPPAIANDVCQVGQAATASFDGAFRRQC
jgi:hypothetical protein